MDIELENKILQVKFLTSSLSPSIKLEKISQLILSKCRGEMPVEDIIFTGFSKLPDTLDFTFTAYYLKNRQFDFTNIDQIRILLAHLYKYANALQCCSASWGTPQLLRSKKINGIWCTLFEYSMYSPWILTRDMVGSPVYSNSVIPTFLDIQVEDFELKQEDNEILQQHMDSLPLRRQKTAFLEYYNLRKSFPEFDPKDLLDTRIYHPNYINGYLNYYPVRVEELLYKSLMKYMNYTDDARYVINGKLKLLMKNLDRLGFNIKKRGDKKDYRYIKIGIHTKNSITQIVYYDRKNKEFLEELIDRKEFKKNGINLEIKESAKIGNSVINLTEEYQSGR